MKKSLAILLAVVFLLLSFTACKKTPAGNVESILTTQDSNATTPTKTDADDPNEETGTTTTTPTMLSLESIGGTGIMKLGNVYTFTDDKNTISMPSWKLIIQEDHVLDTPLRPELNSYTKVTVYQCESKAVKADTLYAGVVEYFDPDNVAGLDPLKLITENQMASMTNSMLYTYVTKQYGEDAYVGNTRLDPYARGNGGFIEKFTAVLRKTPEYEYLSEYLTGYTYAKGYVVARRTTHPFVVFVVDASQGHEYEVLIDEMADILYKSFTNGLPFDKNYTTKAGR